MEIETLQGTRVILNNDACFCFLPLFAHPLLPSTSIPLMAIALCECLLLECVNVVSAAALVAQLKLTCNL